MVHNGIEYGEIQLISEVRRWCRWWRRRLDLFIISFFFLLGRVIVTDVQAYLLLSKYLGMSNEEIADTFEEWNKGDLDSYLIEVR
jgi:6-phosphogluconate dehydrogenase